MGFSKRAQTTLDLLVLILFLFGFAVAVFIGFRVFDDVNDEIQAADLSNESKELSQDLYDAYPSTFDAAFMFFLVLFWAFLIFSSFFIDTHPVFFVVTILLLLVAFVVAMIVSNSYTEIEADTEFSTFSSQFPMMSWVMNHLLVVVIVIGFTTGLALYAKSQ